MTRSQTLMSLYEWSRTRHLTEIPQPLPRMELGAISPPPCSSVQLLSLQIKTTLQKKKTKHKL